MLTHGQTTAMPNPLPAGVDPQVASRILQALISAYGILSLESIRTFANGLFDPARVDREIDDWREEALEHLPSNGSSGSTGADHALARAFLLLMGLGEEENAAEVNEIGISYFTRGFEATVAMIAHAGVI